LVLAVRWVLSDQSSGGSRKFEKGGGRSRKGGGAPPEIAKNSRILGLKFLVLLTFDGKFRAKRGGPGPLGPPSKSATAEALAEVEKGYRIATHTIIFRPSPIKRFPLSKTNTSEVY
jgi:hypothetical protein